MAGNFRNLEGMEFNGFTVLGRHSIDKKGRVIWLCRHTCGDEQPRRGDAVRLGTCVCRSCREVRRKEREAEKAALAEQRRLEQPQKADKSPRTTTRRKSARPQKVFKWPPKVWRAEYQAYVNAKSRCNSSKHPVYHRYGGRGIEFRWADFDEFMDELGPRPTGLTLDRIDNNGHYAKGNCRWVSFRDNHFNREVTLTVTYQGVKHPLLKVLEDHGLGGRYQWALMRIERGYSFDDIMANLIAGNFTFGRKPVPQHTKRMMALPLDQMVLEYLSLPRAIDGRVAHGWLTAMSAHHNVNTFTMIRRVERHLKLCPQLAQLVPCDISHLKLQQRTDLSKKAKAVLEELGLTNDESIKAAITELRLHPKRLQRKAYGMTTYKEICAHVGVEPLTKEARAHSPVKVIANLPERIEQLKQQLARLERKLAAQTI